MSRGAPEFSRMDKQKIRIAEDELNELKQPSVTTWLKSCYIRSKRLTVGRRVTLGERERAREGKKRAASKQDWMLNVLKWLKRGRVIYFDDRNDNLQWFVRHLIFI